MKPNTIELDSKGIFCYEAPAKNLLYASSMTMPESYNGALEQAKRDRVYFNSVMQPKHYITNILFGRSWDEMETGKQYPVPDGFEVKIENDEDYFWKRYAILVPKEKCNGNCGMNYCDENGCMERKRVLVEPYELPKQQSIEEAATDSWNNHGRLIPEASRSSDYMHGFIAGAKSQSAKEKEICVAFAFWLDKNKHSVWSYEQLYEQFKYSINEESDR